MKYPIFIFHTLLLVFNLLGCQSTPEKTIQEKRQAYKLKRCNELLPGVYDSLSIICHDTFLGCSTPMNFFYYPPIRLDFMKESSRPIDLFRQIYTEKKLHKFLKKKHTIKALGFEGKKAPFSTYEMDYEILIQVDQDTFRYRYICPTNFKEFGTNDGIDFEPRFFGNLYKDEPLVCEYILEYMKKEQFIYSHYSNAFFWFWAKKTAEAHHSSLAKELYCESIYTYQYNGGVIDEEKLAIAKKYNCEQLELMLKKKAVRKLTKRAMMQKEQNKTQE